MSKQLLSQSQERWAEGCKDSCSPQSAKQQAFDLQQIWQFFKKTKPKCYLFLHLRFVAQATTAM
jgi:hypothetical protein